MQIFTVIMFSPSMFFFPCLVKQEVRFEWGWILILCSEFSRVGQKRRKSGQNSEEVGETCESMQNLQMSGESALTAATSTLQLPGGTDSKFQKSDPSLQLRVLQKNDGKLARKPLMGACLLLAR